MGAAFREGVTLSDGGKIGKRKTNANTKTM